MDVGNRDMSALFGEQQRHGPAVADRISCRVECSLSAADNQDPAALKASAARRITRGLRTERTYVTRLVSHFYLMSFPAAFAANYFGANPNVCSNRLA